ncbi:MAG: molybdopterin converting factor subunit 1 [Pseudomonadota bacterium]|nr:molybdopterin converting factor subunit 1 [Hyphomicrobiales bacterium]MAP06453.1 molybdopterin converting factor subunit 1 [Rhodobiaceae bacterium]MEC7270264.1 molybdopterin converting factor subunit 1 [Pseudomonadota bacterium]MEC8448025.1 molybdopterin converting factor subunit 1 [Pseudomonadota bacterium]|tara:strand:- start:160 stop:411 length:252 start_codon:yes stop_codon:yes gene_type:complete
MNLKYFAWIAEIIDKREESLEIPSGIETIGQLIDYLSSIDEAYKKAFEKRKSIKFAVNQVLVNENELISKADEVAFFPPMTGG